MLNKLEVAMADMQRDQAAAMLTFEQRHWAALLGNEQRLTERIEEGNVQVVAALALKLDTIQVGRALRRAARVNCGRGNFSQPVRSVHRAAAHVTPHKPLDQGLDTAQLRGC